MKKNDMYCDGLSKHITRMLRMFTIGAIVTVFGACAAPNPVRVAPEVEKQAKEMLPPAGKALVYIIREDQLAGSLSELVIEVNKSILGSMYTGMFLFSTVELGANTISASINPGRSPWIAFNFSPHKRAGKYPLITRINDSISYGGNWFNVNKEGTGIAVSENKEYVDAMVQSIFSGSKEKIHGPIRIIKANVKFPITINAKAGEKYFLRYTDRMSGKVWDVLTEEEGRKYINNFHLSGQTEFTKYWVYQNNLEKYLDSLQ